MECSSTTTMDDLPERIFFHILSFLPTFDAIRASAVSRKWRNLWHSVPVLNFHIRPFRFRFQNKTLPEVRQLFAEFICRTLFLRQPLCSPLRKFKLKFDYANYGRHKCHVDSWIRYAINSNAVELDLKFDARIYNIKYYAELGEGNAGEDEDEDEDDDNHLAFYFHFSDLINSSVQVLKLRGCELCLPNPAISIASLKSISLASDYCCYLTSAEVSNMVSLCANLQYLSIDCHCGAYFKNLKIESPKLKELVLSHYEDSSTEENSVEICAPSLVPIRFESFFTGKYILRDSSSLVAAHLYFRPISYWEFAC